MLHKLLEKIKNNCIITKQLFEDYNLGDVLNLRDNDIFDSKWVELYNSLEKLEVSNDSLKLINEIKKEIFIKVCNISEDSELASYISDDFELICKAYIFNINNNWLNSIIYLYANNIIPCGNIDVIESNIKEVLNQLLNK